MDPLSFPTLKQLSVSNKPSCRLYPDYKKIIDFTSFLPENTSFKIRYWYFQNQITSPVLCACGCKIPLKMPQISKYASGHSNAAPEVKEKKKQNLQKKHGDNITNVSQLKEVKEKKKQTTLKNYGVESPFCHKHMSKVWMEMWGVDNPSKLESVKKQLSEKHKIIQKEKREQKIVARLKNFYQKLVSHPHFEPVFSEEEYRGCRKFYPFKCRRCGTITEDNLSDGTHFRCYKCTPRVGSGAQSLIEKELEEFCQKLDSSVITQSRKIISPLELDMFFPNQKIAVELNGLYFHSEKMGKGRSYHLSKTQSCENLNILLLQIFEDEWNNKKEICKSRIRHSLGLTPYKIFARQCEVRIVPKDQKDSFLDKYHIQGKDNSSVHLGLFYRNRLISVMTFGSLRRATGYSLAENCWELIRFCSIKNFSVVGGAQKLFQHFLKKYNPFQILSFADRRWSNGQVYSKLGFEFKGYTSPNYWYIFEDQRLHRFGFQKHLLKDKLKTFDPLLTEKENMSNNGYTRIWDCGHSRWIWAKENL